jgi:hypothetical protein
MAQIEQLTPTLNVLMMSYCFIKLTQRRINPDIDVYFLRHWEHGSGYPSADFQGQAAPS